MKRSHETPPNSPMTNVCSNLAYSSVDRSRPGCDTTRRWPISAANKINHCDWKYENGSGFGCTAKWDIPYSIVPLRWLATTAVRTWLATAMDDPFRVGIGRRTKWQYARCPPHFWFSSNARFHMVDRRDAFWTGYSTRTECDSRSTMSSPWRLVKCGRPRYTAAHEQKWNITIVLIDNISAGLTLANNW